MLELDSRAAQPRGVDRVLTGSLGGDVTVELQPVFQNVGFGQLADPRWSSRAANAARTIVSARPRKFLRVYSMEPSGPQNVFWLVVNYFGTPMGGIPGSATVPLGMLPPRLITWNPNP